MTAQDEAELRELQAEFAAAELSPWQPGCVSAVFCRPASREPFVFRMQTWIDLEAVQSPFLLGELPEAEEAVSHFEDAFAAFGYDKTRPEACDPDELVAVGEKIISVIKSGFAMRLRLCPPAGQRAAQGATGLGDWLQILACLKTQMGFSLSEALRLPVGQAFALVAGHRVNEGWHVAGDTYVDRDVED